jgi:large subunit ribosomal protein L35
MVETAPLASFNARIHPAFRANGLKFPVNALALSAAGLYTHHSVAHRPIWAAESCRSTSPQEEMEMPKMKTKSSAKKRFKVTASGLVMSAQAGKRHGMIKRSTKFIRQARGTNVLSDPDARIVKSYMPYNR